MINKANVYLYAVIFDSCNCDIDKGLFGVYTSKELAEQAINEYCSKKINNFFCADDFSIERIKLNDTLYC